MRIRPYGHRLRWPVAAREMTRFIGTNGVFSARLAARRIDSIFVSG